MEFIVLIFKKNSDMDNMLKIVIESGVNMKLSEASKSFNALTLASILYAESFSIKILRIILEDEANRLIDVD